MDKFRYQCLESLHNCCIAFCLNDASGDFSAFARNYLKKAGPINDREKFMRYLHERLGIKTKRFKIHFDKELRSLYQTAKAIYKYYNRPDEERLKYAFELLGHQMVSIYRETADGYAITVLQKHQYETVGLVGVADSEIQQLHNPKKWTNKDSVYVDIMARDTFIFHDVKQTFTQLGFVVVGECKVNMHTQLIVSLMHDEVETGLFNLGRDLNKRGAQSATA